MAVSYAEALVAQGRRFRISVALIEVNKLPGALGAGRGRTLRAGRKQVSANDEHLKGPTAHDPALGEMTLLPP